MANFEDYSLNRFLSLSRYEFENYKNEKPITVIIGNESCDLDTAVSCITYSYLTFFGLLTANRNVDNHEDIIIPVLNVDKIDYPVKTEVKYFLSDNNISENDIVFRDEIDLHHLHKEKRLKLILVDHHVLQEEFDGLESSVIKILDHRPKDKSSNWNDDIARIELVGSCSTLVCDEIIKKDETILSQNTDIANLIYGTIILDTCCFSDTMKKYTPLDQLAAEKCKTLGKIELSEKDMFIKLKQVKAEISHLTPLQLLVKDMKSISTIPISTLTTSAEVWVGKPDTKDSIDSFCQKYNPPIFIVLGVSMDGDVYKRDMFIYYNNNCTNKIITEKGGSDALAQCVIRHFNDYTLLDLEFIKEINSGYLLKQNNVTLSRKQILPIVKNAFKDFTEDY